MADQSFKFIQFFPTLRCNRRCRFCFNKKIPYMPDTPIQALEELATNLAGNGIMEIDILGGEPTLYPGLGHLVEAAAENRVHAYLSSNGSDPAALDRLADRFGGALTVGVSLNDEETPATLDDFIFRRRPLLKSVCRRGMPNWYRMERYLNSGLQFFLLFMDALSDEDLAESLAFYEYMEILDRMRRDYPRAGGVYCSGFIPCEDEPVSAARCPAGSAKLSILPDGSVYPCYLLFGRKEFRLGNIFEDTLCSIWENPALDFFKKSGGNNCLRTECSFFRKCRGGCPAVSLSVAGRLDAPDPRCYRQFSHLD